MTDFLGGGGPKPLVADGLDITSATSTLTIPIGWGTNILSGNLTVVTGVVHHNGDGSKGASKGGAGPYYTAYLMFALGIGTSTGLAQAYQGSSIHYGAEYGSADGGWLASVQGQMFFGSGTQTAWSGWSGSYAYAAAFGNYRYLTYIALPRFNIGGGPVPPNFNYLVEWDSALFAPYSKSWRGGGLRRYVAKGGDPGLIVNDLINGPSEQGRGFPGIKLDKRTVLTANAPNPAADSTFQTWCWANSIDFSPVLRDAQKGGDILDHWAEYLQFEIGYWDGMLKIVSRGDTAQTGNGLTFTPAVTPLTNFTADDFITDDTEMPVHIDIKEPNECFNIVRIEVTDQLNEWSPLPVEQREETDIFLNGGIERIRPTVQAHEVTDAQNVAPILARLLLQRALHFDTTYTFKLANVWGALLTPMDVVTLTDPDSGLINELVRIQSLEPDGQGVITVTAENLPIGAGTAALYALQPPASQPVNTNADGGSVNPPVIFEAPSTLYSPATLVLAISGGFGDEANTLWGGCYILASVGSGAYQQIGKTENGPATTGKLTASLAAYSGSNLDTTDTLTVELNESAGMLASVSSASAAAFQSLCYLDSELLSYTTATLTSVTLYVIEALTVPAAPGPYTLTVLNASNFVADVSLAYASGGTLTKITSGTPATGQYVSLGGGSYQMASGDAGAVIDVTYQRTAPAYQLTGLYRGLYGTTAGAHAAGAHFAFLANSAPVKITVPAGYIGQTISLKFQSFNTWGNGLQDPSTLPVYTVAIAGTGFGGGSAGVPTVPTGLSTVGGNQTVVLSWSPNPATDNVTEYLLYRASGSGASFGSAALISTGPGLGFTDTGLGTNVSYTYFLVAQNAVGKSSNTAGVSVTTLNGAVPSTAPLTATQNLPAGAFVNIFASGGVAQVRLADATAGQPAVGYVLSAVSSGAQATVFFQGVNTALSGLSPGSPYWLGTSGGVTNTPSFSGPPIQPLGIALSATALTFQLQGINN